MRVEEYIVLGVDVDGLTKCQDLDPLLFRHEVQSRSAARKRGLYFTVYHKVEHSASLGCAATRTTKDHEGPRTTIPNL